VPGNIFLEAGPQSHVKTTDFGLARAVDDVSQAQSGLLAGTPMFMSPEQAKGETLDHQTDLFSLGSVLDAIVSGRSPFRGNLVAPSSRGERASR
jgi:serine/threonine protein kinase